VRKKTGGEKMPVQMIGDILAAELSHMQAYIRFCSCQLNGAALLQQKTDEDADFKEFLKVTPFWILQHLSWIAGTLAPSEPGGSSTLPTGDSQQGRRVSPSASQQSINTTNNFLIALCCLSGRPEFS
jgi:hypothetical protein